MSENLTVGDLLYLAGLVDQERVRLRQMIEDEPDSKETNEYRHGEITKLDLMTEKLVAAIGAPKP